MTFGMVHHFLGGVHGRLTAYSSRRPPVRRGRDVVGGEAGHALVDPGGAVVERNVEADVLRRAQRTDVAAVAELLVDEHHRVEPIGLRMEADALQLFVGGVALQLDDRLERALRQVPEIVRVADDERAEPRPFHRNVAGRADSAGAERGKWLGGALLIVRHDDPLRRDMRSPSGKRRIITIRTAPRHEILPGSPIGRRLLTPARRRSIVGGIRWNGPLAGLRDGRCDAP